MQYPYFPIICRYCYMLSLQQYLNRLDIFLARPFCSCDRQACLEKNQRQQNFWRLWLVMALLASLLPAEIAIGLWSHSLSLQADAGHLLADITAVGLTLLANWLAQRPATPRATFGHQRVEVLAALFNGIGLVAIASSIAIEAIQRFPNPEPILSLPLLLGAGLGLAVNTLNLTLLHKHDLDNLNIRAAVWHIVADVTSCAGILLTAVLVSWLKWWWIDPVISMLIACFAMFWAISLIRTSVEILLEYAPRSINPKQVEAALQLFPGVQQVEMLRIWTIASGQTILCAQLQIEPLDAHKRDRLQWELQTYLAEAFGIYESTLQLSSYCSTNLALHPLLNRSLVSHIHQQLPKFTHPNQPIEHP